MSNANIIVKPNFHFEGTGWDLSTMIIAKSIFHEVRSKWVPLVNEIIDKANKEWDILHPEISSMDDDSPEWKAYVKFIAEKYKPACNKVTKEYLGNLPFRAGSDPESSDFTLELSNNKGYLWCDYTIVNQ